MEAILSPAQIAREALHRLAAERVLPTPDNYRDTYDAIAGAPSLPQETARPYRELLVAVLEERLPAVMAGHDDLLQEARVLAGRLRAGSQDDLALVAELDAL